jgi:hypothetical protein
VNLINGKFLFGRGIFGEAPFERGMQKKKHADSLLLGGTAIRGYESLSQHGMGVKMKGFASGCGAYEPLKE